MDRKKIWLLTVLIAAVGCRIQEPAERPAGNFYLSPTADFEQIGKVVMLELDNPTSHPEQGRIFSEMLADGLGKKHLFSVRMIRREEPSWRQLDLDSIRRSTPQQLAEIRQNLGADAVVFGTMGRYSPYPHLLLSVHLKMLDLRTARIVWAIEDVWDSSDRLIQQRIRRYFETQMRTGYEPLNWKIVENSPLYFNKFVVFEITETLPSYQTMQKELSSEKNGLLSPVSKISAIF
ncbi:MAG TPA: hypothetical protein PK054_10230 [Anaerohalosphaeraceae bacterium]|nr:hypothetical protein [Anaerohalosphaeraceae bacterium]HOL88481.1 hypothetical protein [Anaerohalosphaeraceae bacterium]HPP56942.1 hypothetical protein [Anaerohalosphaeraceae bacterium]